MEEEKSNVEEMIESLKRQRDELALQIHLGNMEAKEEFEKARKRLERLMNDFEPLRGAVEESAETMFTSMKKVGDELLSSFGRVRKSLK